MSFTVADAERMILHEGHKEFGTYFACSPEMENVDEILLPYATRMVEDRGYDLVRESFTVTQVESPEGVKESVYFWWALGKPKT